MSRVPACLVALLLIPSLSAAQATGGITFGTTGGIVIGPGDSFPQQPPRDSQPIIGRSTIHGHVVDAGSGQPMRRVVIRISAPELRGQRTTMTDADGRYEFGQLPAGRYSVNASKAAYVGWAYGQTQPSSPGKPVVLGDNQAVENIDIRLPRGAVITGHVIDEFGDPVPNAGVTTMRQTFNQGQRRVTPTGGRVTTNDIGEYRIFGLAPGQYYVSASLAQGGIINFNGVQSGPEDRSGYASTYYPGTADVSGAQKLNVTVAQTLNDINITLQPTRLATISGIAVDAEGRPLPNGNVMTMPRGGNMGGNGAGGPLREGIFTIANVPPGDYLLRANAMQAPPAPGTPFSPPEFSVAVVSVNGEDLTGVRLAPVAWVTVSGRVNFDDPLAAQSLKPSSIRVMQQPFNPEDMMGMAGPQGPPQTAKDDFTFELKAAPGRIVLRPNVLGPGVQGPWVLKAIRINGADVTDRGIDVGSQDVTGVDIELTNQAQQITGQVTAGAGTPVKDYVAVFFAQDRTRWTAAGNRYFATGRPGDDGHFKVSVLPPGEYFAIALDHADPNEYQDPDFLEGLSRQATTVSLSEGETKVLDLRLFTLQ